MPEHVGRLSTRSTEKLKVRAFSSVICLMDDKQRWKASSECTSQSLLATRATRRVDRWFVVFRARKQSLSKKVYLDKYYLANTCTSINIS